MRNMYNYIVILVISLIFDVRLQSDLPLKPLKIVILDLLKSTSILLYSIIYFNIIIFYLIIISYYIIINKINE